VNGADPIHTVIKRYRDARAILLNIEQRLMMKFAPNLQTCTIAQRIEVFEVSKQQPHRAREVRLAE
jgi:FKBP12-rapamycin complex-associated protein